VGGDISFIVGAGLDVAVCFVVVAEEMIAVRVCRGGLRILVIVAAGVVEEEDGLNRALGVQEGKKVVRRVGVHVDVGLVPGRDGVVETGVDDVAV
jgi:hypothetical protein